MKTFSSIKVGKTSLGAIINRDRKSATVRTKRISITDKDIEWITEEGVTISRINFKNCYFYDDVFSCVNFMHCIFENCTFGSATILTSTFSDCVFSDVVIRDCIINFCGFNSCSFDDLCVISDNVFRDSGFNSTNFHNAYVKRGNTFLNCDLTNAISPPYVKMACPTHGSFIGWKKVYDGEEGYCLVKLEIPAKAKRSSATSRKCRAEYAKVLGVYTSDLKKIDCKKVVSFAYTRCVYEVGKIVYPDAFDENRYDECSNGIHFFIDVNDAIEY